MIALDAVSVRHQPVSLTNVSLTWGLGVHGVVGAPSDGGPLLLVMDPRAVGRIPGALRAKAREGCSIVIATASMHDAGDLADDHVLLRAGAVVARLAAIEELAGFSPEGATMHVVARDGDGARALVDAEPAVMHVG